MKNLSIAFIFVLIFSTVCSADLRFYTLEEQVEESDFIVVGKLNSISTYNKEYEEVSEGILTIEKTVSQNIKTINGKSLNPGDKIIVKWRQVGACRFSYSENDHGIWFLLIDEDKTAKAFNQSLTNLEQIRKVNNLIQKTKKNKIVKIINPGKKYDSTQDALIRGLLVFIIALILYRLLYRARFKIKVKKEKKEKE